MPPLLFAALSDGGGSISIDEYDTRLHRGRITCPTCSAPLTARRGPLRVHHFKHRTSTTCGIVTSEPEPVLTEWRRKWLGRWGRERTLRHVTHANKTCVADVVTERGTAVLLQHSSITLHALYEREDFFLAATGRLPAWFFNMTNLVLPVELRGQDFVVARVPCAAWASARGPAFLDTVDGLFLIVAQNLAHPDMVVARPTPFKSGTLTLPVPPTPVGALPLSLDTTGRITAASFLATDTWRNVSRHFRWDSPPKSWNLYDFVGAASDKYGRPASLWLPMAPVGAPPTDPRATLRRDRVLSSTLRGFVNLKRGPLELPTGALPAPLEAVRARGVRDLTSTIFANVVAWNERLPGVTNQWLVFFRSLGWWANTHCAGELSVKVPTSPGVRPCAHGVRRSSTPLHGALGIGRGAALRGGAPTAHLLTGRDVFSGKTRTCGVRRRLHQDATRQGLRQ